MSNPKEQFRIQLTPEQKSQVKTPPGKEAEAVELSVEELEERIAPGKRTFAAVAQAGAPRPARQRWSGLTTRSRIPTGGSAPERRYAIGSGPFESSDRPL